MLNLQKLETDIKSDGILYFLESGHFLFRFFLKNRWESKFLTIEDVAASFVDEETDTGWIQKNIIRAGRSARGDWFVYFAPAQQKQLTFHLPGETVSLKVPIPTTVLIGVGHSYYLFAVADAAPSPRSKIYHAPFPNIYSNGRICWGNNPHPKAHHSQAAAVWNLFFGTPFNTHLANGKSNAFPKDVTEHLRALADARKYPQADLMELNTTLEYCVGRILDRNWRD